MSSLLNIFLYRPDLNLGTTIQALENKQLAQTLAEPNLLTVAGKAASFLAGGEIPVPIAQPTPEGPRWLRSNGRSTASGSISYRC